MAFQWNLLEDILDSVLHIANSFKIVGAEAKLTVFNAAVDKDKTVFYSAYFRSNQVAFDLKKSRIINGFSLSSICYLHQASAQQNHASPVIFIAFYKDKARVFKLNLKYIIFNLHLIIPVNMTIPVSAVL